MDTDGERIQSLWCSNGFGQLTCIRYLSFGRLYLPEYSLLRFQSSHNQGIYNEKTAQEKTPCLSRSIVLVLDTESKLVQTRRTQPTCHMSARFDEAIQAIKSLRIGGELAKAIRNCSMEFAQGVNSATKQADGGGKIQVSKLTDAKIDNSYLLVEHRGRSQLWHKIPAGKKDSPMLYLACGRSIFLSSLPVYAASGCIKGGY